MNEKADPSLVGSMDQFAANSATMADAAAQYHRALKNGGTPDALAANLTRDFHWLLWHRTFWPDISPTTAPFGG